MGSELPLLLLWKRSPQKVKNRFLYLTHSLSSKYAPDPALFTQDILLREYLIQTLLKIGWMMKMLT